MYIGLKKKVVVVAPNPDALSSVNRYRKVKEVTLPHSLSSIEVLHPIVLIGSKKSYVVYNLVSGISTQISRTVEFVDISSFSNFVGMCDSG